MRRTCAASRRRRPVVLPASKVRQTSGAEVPSQNPGKGLHGHATRASAPRPHVRAKQKPPVSRSAFPKTVFRFRPSNPLISSFILFIRGQTPCPHAALHLDTRAPPIESFTSPKKFLRETTWTTRDTPFNVRRPNRAATGSAGVPPARCQKTANK